MGVIGYLVVLVLTFEILVNDVLENSLDLLPDVLDGVLLVGEVPDDDGVVLGSAKIVVYYLVHFYDIESYHYHKHLHQ